MNTQYFAANPHFLSRVAGWLLVVAGCLLILDSARAEAVGTQFTYQGRLQDAGQPANGLYDLRFQLHDVANGTGAYTSGELTLEDVPVEDGVFSVALDFGAMAFAGDARWLSIQVRDGDSNGAFDMLSPRQAVTATPYALYALEGNTGPQGPAGPSGVVNTYTFAGSIGTIAAGGGGVAWAFAGPTTTVTVATGQRITGAGVASVGHTSANIIPVAATLCWSLVPAGSPLTAFYPTSYIDTTVSAEPEKTLLSAAASVSLSAGVYRVGFCIKNKSSSIPLSANDFANGWVMVTN